MDFLWITLLLRQVSCFVGCSDLNTGVLMFAILAVTLASMYGIYAYHRISQVLKDGSFYQIRHALDYPDVTNY